MIVGVDGGAGACAAIDDAAAMVVSTANASEGRVVVRMAVEGSGADSSVNRVRPSVLGKLGLFGQPSVATIRPVAGPIQSPPPTVLA